MPLDCLCIGGANIDGSFHLGAAPILGTSNPSRAEFGFGGVARNVAEWLGRLRARVGLLTNVGADARGWEIIDDLAAAGVDAGLVHAIPGEATSRYLAIIRQDGELFIGANAMQIIERISPADILDAPLDDAEWVFAECNLAAETLATAITRRRDGGTFRLAVDGVSIPKSLRLPADLRGIDLLCCNVDEANAILAKAEPATRDGARALAAGLLQRGAAAAMVTLGADGCVVDSEEGAWHVGAVPARLVDGTGAGDARIAGTLLGLITGAPLHLAARDGSLLAALATESTRAIEPRTTPAFVAANAFRLDDVLMEGPLP